MENKSVFICENKICVYLWISSPSVDKTQLIQTNFLNRMREYFLVRTLIGSVFNVWDFLWYFVGGVGGWGVMELIFRNAGLGNRRWGVNDTTQKK